MVKVPGADDKVPVVVVDFNVVVVVVVVVVLVKDGGAGADGRTRHGRTESMERKKKSRTENNLMFRALDSLSYCAVTTPFFYCIHPSIIGVYSNNERGFV